jgi:hypothetical protein
MNTSFQIGKLTKNMPCQFYNYLFKEITNKKKVVSFIVCLLIFVLDLASQEIDLQRGLIAYYSFNGDAKSESGFQGEVFGAQLVTDKDSNSNSAYQFQGPDDYIRVNNFPELSDISSTGFSMSFWLKIDTPQVVALSKIIGYGGYGVGGWEFLAGYDKIQFALRSNSNGINYFEPFYCPTFTKKWTHIAVNLLGDTVWMYVDGHLQGSRIGHKFSPFENHLDLVIGSSSNHPTLDGFTGKIDEVRFYKRILSKKEIAYLSGYENIIDFVKKGYYFYSNFENNSLLPQLGYHRASLYGDGKLYVMPNPDKCDDNNSDFVMMPVTKRGTGHPDYERAEYNTELEDYYTPTLNQKLIYQWQVYFPDNFLNNVEISGDWSYIAQFSNCGKYTGYGNFICEEGGIFNDVKLNDKTMDEYLFRYRALPNCYNYHYKFEKEKWLTLTYEILWKTNEEGYCKLWVNDSLMFSKYNFQTLISGYNEHTCEPKMKLGLYDSWTSSTVDSLYYYIDNLKIFINESTQIACPGCEVGTQTDELVFESIEIFPNPTNDYIWIKGINDKVEIKIYDSQGCIVKEEFVQGGFDVHDLFTGVYLVNIKKQKFVTTKVFVKK